MIITLTVNPAIDLTVALDEFVPGDANRIQSSRTDPGGKGINVSRALLELGTESMAMGFISGARGRFIEQSLRDSGIYTDFLHTAGQTRTNITILDRKHNTTTTLNERGPQMTPQHINSLMLRLKKQLHDGDWLVIGGSIPPGVSPDFYGQVIRLANKMGVRCILDADGEPFQRALEARPYLVKPNREEVSRILGKMPKSPESLMDAAEQIHALGVEVVILSQGVDGAIMVTDQGAWRAYPPQVTAVSSVGSGDAMVAALVQTLSQGRPLVQALRLGTAAGASAALTPGTLPCRQADVLRLLPRVQVHPITRQPGKFSPAMAGVAPK